MQSIKLPSAHAFRPVLFFIIAVVLAPFLAAQSIGPEDFGDAPLPYPTLRTNNGPHHLILQGFHLGSRIDAEPDGQPNASGLGDDIPTAAGSGDEDGVSFTASLIPGQAATLSIVASESGKLDAWIDFAGDGSWGEASDQIFTNLTLNGGINTLAFAIPVSARAGSTFARFRFSRKGGLPFSGAAQDGEVEDYRVQIAAAPALPCDLTNAGSDFWLTFPANYAPDPLNRPQLSLHLAGAPNVSGQVAIPGLSFLLNWTLPATGVTNINLPWQADLGNLNDSVTNKGIHITAAGEVAVYALNHIPFTSDGYLGLPTSVLGTEYIVLGYPNAHTDVPELNGSQFAIVATENNTLVTITPRVFTSGHPPGIPFSITMNRGETYQLRNTNNFPSDLSGTIITASRAIGVFGGHRSASISGNTQLFCNTLVEQLLPIAAWGTNFVSMPLASRIKGDTYRILASQSNTAVKTNGTLAAVLNRGDVFERIITGSVHISSDKPVFPAQYSSSFDHDSVTNSDPFMILLPPAASFRGEYTLFAMTNGFVTNFINVVVPNTAISQISLDGTLIPPGAFSSIPAAGPASGFSGAQLPVTPGKHTLTQSSSVASFGASVYGFARYDSYGYPAGLRFGDNQPPIITCPGDQSLTANPTNCTASVPLFLASVQDNCTAGSGLKIIQTPPSGTSLGPGTYELVLSCTDLAGNKATCVSKLIVLDAAAPTIQCPSNITVRTTNPKGQIVNFDVNASSPCNPKIGVSSDPPSGSTFPIGTTVVTCSATVPGPNPSIIKCSFTVTVVPLRIDVTIGKQTITLNWAGNDTLQSASSIAGPWSVVPAKSPFSITNDQIIRLKSQFFRLHCDECP